MSDQHHSGSTPAPISARTLGILLELEEIFGIALPERDVLELGTPGELIDLILAKCPPEPTGHALTKAQRGTAYLHLRRAFVRAEIGETKSFRPQTRLEDLLPLGSRKRSWQRFGAEVGSEKWQPLGRPFSLLAGMGAAGLFVGLVCWNLATTHLIPHLPDYLADIHNLCALAGALAAWWIMGIVTRPARTSLPLGVKTVEDLAAFVVRLEPEAFPHTPIKRERETIAKEVAKSVRSRLESGEIYADTNPWPTSLAWVHAERDWTEEEATASRLT